MSRAVNSIPVGWVVRRLRRLLPSRQTSESEGEEEHLQRLRAVYGPKSSETAGAQVQVCLTCGHINPVGGSGSCEACWISLARAPVVTEAQGEQMARLRRLRFRRTRLVRFAILLALASGFTVWGVLVFFELGSDPPKATTDISASQAPGSWAQGRRTPQNTGFTPDQAPIPQRVEWTYSSSEPLLSSPAVVGTRVYFTTEGGRAISLDRRTGQVMWEYTIGGASSSTPAVLEDLVIFGARDGRVIAVDRRTGVLRWETPVGGGVHASPIVVDGSVYVGAGDHNIYALDAATGKKRWSFETKDWVVASVAYADKAVVVVSTDSIVHVIDTETGRKRFVYDSGRPSYSSGPAIHERIAIFNSDRGTVWAIERGAITYPFERAIWRWKVQLAAWGIFSEIPQQKGTVWNVVVGGDLIGTPAVAHNTVYTVNEQGKVFALDAATGEERWITELEAIITASPSVAGTTVLVGTKDGTVFGLDAQTGKVLWDFHTGGEIADSPIVAGDGMYVVSREGTLSAISGTDQ